jgi:hypothetical protein
MDVVDLNVIRDSFCLDGLSLLEGGQGLPVATD